MESGFGYMPARAEDAPVIYGLAKGLVDRYEDCTAIDYEKVLSWMERKIKSHIDEYTCIVRQGQTVGYYRLCSENGELELDDFYILPAFRNQGIGTRVMRKILSEANYAVFCTCLQRIGGLWPCTSAWDLFSESRCRIHAASSGERLDIVCVQAYNIRYNTLRSAKK